MREAMFYEKKDGARVHCRLCPKLCTIREGHQGFCRVRQNRGGTLYPVNYGRVSSCGMDPIEKKPLYHFYPGHYILSLGTAGCNLRCGFCQNWEIAHGDPRTTEVTPQQVVELARRQGGRNRPNVGVAFTYNEPFMWYEFVWDTAPLIHQAGLKNVLVTNGYVNEEPLRRLLPYIDAMNIDVKGFTGEYYKENCAGRLEPVLRTVEIAHRQCHVELTTLLVTGLNDSRDEIRRLVEWVASLDPQIPLHFSRYFPNFEVDLPPTPLETLKTAYAIAREKLSYVYIGNAPQMDGSDTICPRCGATVIARTGYSISAAGLAKGRCARCGTGIPIAGEPA
ncbi:MAG: AmmeMemoRadiSam system radical SAM enzyme [Peptococcaceae bacterium]|nr:AmmeMemoRadiSam system radical SAM enzyme [Peptococcaceae bacterium]